MVADIHKLIAAVSPNVYCDSSVRKDVKKIIKKELARGNDKAYLEAAKETKNITSKEFFFYDEALKEPFKKWGIKSPTEQHELIYDSATDSLEPLYFWTIDFMKNYFSKIEKLTDNFTSSPGSGHFSEMGQKATRMQEEAMKMLGAANQVLKSVLNLVYDLKEMKLLVQTYDDIKSKDLKLKSAARLSLKQRWMDMVDIKKGQGSINALASGNLDFVTLRDAFMISNSLKEVKDLDLNERVKRILEQRVGEFLRWIEESERQLRTI
jgi:hypothetical protein